MMLSYMVESFGLNVGTLGYMLEYWVSWWTLFGSTMGMLGYMVESAGLHGGECWVTWWGVLGYMVESAGLHGGECWVIW